MLQITATRVPAMSRKILSAALLLVSAGAAAAQAPAPAPTYIVTRLGVDTIAVERYTRSPGKLEGDLILRNPRIRTFHYTADLAPNGVIKSLTIIVRRPGTDASAPPVMRAVTTFSDSIAVIDVERNGQPDTVASARKIFHGAVSPAFPTHPPAFGIYEQILSTAGLGRDSVAYALIGLDGGPAPSIILRRRGADSVAFTSTFFPGWTEVARVDSRGRIMGINAMATTVKTMSERDPKLNFDAISSAWAAIESAKGATGQMSPPDTTRATIGTANIEVAYSRPAKRSRVIFGKIVPWNEVWRTGANAATQLTTSADLVFGSTVLPAGKYTLWTLPTPSGAKLIINSETGQWGTDYHAEKDVVRLDLTLKKLSAPVERFVIGVAPQGAGGVFTFAWDDREYSLPFQIK